MGLVLHNNNQPVLCARCGLAADQSYDCSDCGVHVCLACGEMEQAGHGPQLCVGRAVFEQAAANEALIAVDPDLAGQSADNAAKCRLNELCPSCRYPRDASAAEAKLHHLARLGQPLTKTAMAGVKMSGKQAHCVLPQTLLRTRTRQFLAPLAERSPCELLQPQALAALQDDYRRAMLAHCLQPLDKADAAAMAQHIESKYRDRPPPQDVLQRVNALPVGGAVQQADAQAQPAQTPDAWYATMPNKNHHKDMQGFIRRYPGCVAQLEDFVPPDKPGPALLVLVLRVPDPESGGWSIIRRNFSRTNGKAGKEVSSYADHDEDGQLVESGPLDSMAKAADRSWPARAFGNLMKPSLTRGNQCAYCEELQGDFSLPQRLAYAQGSPAPEGFVGNHLLDEVAQAGGIEPYMAGFLDTVCVELAHTLKTACDFESRKGDEKK